MFWVKKELCGWVKERWFCPSGASLTRSVPRGEHPCHKVKNDSPNLGFTSSWKHKIGKKRPDQNGWFFGKSKGLTGLHNVWDGANLQLKGDLRCFASWKTSWKLLKVTSTFCELEKRTFIQSAGKVTWHDRHRPGLCNLIASEEFFLFGDGPQHAELDNKAIQSWVCWVTNPKSPPTFAETWAWESRVCALRAGMQSIQKKYERPMLSKEYMWDPVSNPTSSSLSARA